MTTPLVYRSFAEELSKIAVKVPFYHGTSGSFKRLVPDAVPPNLKGDPNQLDARRVFLTMKNRKNRRLAEGFADEAVAAKGSGTPTVLSGKVDTEKGWGVSNLKKGPSVPIKNLDDAEEILFDLDQIKGNDHAARAERGPLWRKLQKSVGTIINMEDPSAPVAVMRSHTKK